MAGGINPFGFAVSAPPAPAPRAPIDLPSAPFGFAPPPSKWEQTAAILNEYNPIDAFWRLYNSDMAKGGAITDQNIEDGMMVGGTVMGGGAMIPKPANALNMGIRAYHGSPHSFDKFSMDKIGTGEGAQAYGHGLYFAENEGVARGYREALANGYRIDGKEYNASTTKAGAVTPGHHAADALDRFKGDKKAAIEWLNGGGPVDKEAAKLLKKAKSIEPWNGSMYEVNIDADPNAFLDWDKPLSEQPPQMTELVRQALKDKGYLRANDNGPRQLTSALKAWRMAEGGMFETSMEALLGGRGGMLGKTAEEASAKLREAGIPGIKYLDAGSRGAGDGTRNYVVFDDKLISIVRKYGIAGASAMLGYNLLESVNPAQADELKRIEAGK